MFSFCLNNEYHVQQYTSTLTFSKYIISYFFQKFTRECHVCNIRVINVMNNQRWIVELNTNAILQRFKKLKKSKKVKIFKDSRALIWYSKLIVNSEKKLLKSRKFADMTNIWKYEHVTSLAIL